MTRIVAVHGNGGGSTRFARMADYLPDGVTLEAIDLPGFNGVPLDPAVDSVPTYADRLGELIGDGPAPVLLSHGIGGSIALDLVSRRPDLVSGFILHAPVGADLDRRLFPRVMSTAPVRETMRRLIAAKAPRPLWRKLFFPTGAPKADIDQFFDGYRSCDAFGLMFEVITVDWFNSVEPVRDVPSILLWGEHDRVLKSKQADSIAQKLPEARRVIHPGWDHFPMLEQPEEYADVVANMAVELASSS